MVIARDILGASAKRFGLVPPAALEWYRHLSPDVGDARGTGDIAGPVSTPYDRSSESIPRETLRCFDGRHIRSHAHASAAHSCADAPRRTRPMETAPSSWAAADRHRSARRAPMARATTARSMTMPQEPQPVAAAAVPQVTSAFLLKHPMPTPATTTTEWRSRSATDRVTRSRYRAFA